MIKNAMGWMAVCGCLVCLWDTSLRAQIPTTTTVVPQGDFQQTVRVFVPVWYRQPLISSALIASLAKPDFDASPTQKDVADKISLAAAAAVQYESQAMLLELMRRQQVMRQSGMTVGGERSTLQTAGLAAKYTADQERIKTIQSKLALEREKRKFRLENRKENEDYVKEVIQRRKVDGMTAKSGYSINVILDAIKPTILEYGYGISSSDNFKQRIDLLQISPADIAKIQLQLQAEGPPVIFTANAGAVDLGKLPFNMNHPELFPLVQEIESKIKELADLKQVADFQKIFYEKTRQLAASVEELEEASVRVLGTAQESARRGSKDFRLWSMAKNYRSRMQGIVNRLEMENSPKFLQASASKYDPDVHGTGVFGFVRFIAESNCKVAPAAQGDEGAYANFLSSLLMLKEIIGGD